MEAIIDHHPEHGGYIQVAHGKECLSLIVENDEKPSDRAFLTLTPKEAVDLGLDLILQATYSQRE